MQVLVFSLFFTLSSGLTLANSQEQTSTVVRIEENLKGSFLILNPSTNVARKNRLRLPLFEVTVLGTIPLRADAFRPAKRLIISAKPCRNCAQDKAIYMVSFSDSPIKTIFPGKILDPKYRSTMLESRMFFGHCLRGKSPGLFVFQRERSGRKGSFETSVLALEITPKRTKETLFTSGRSRPKISDPLKFIKKKLCSEISGRNRIFNPKLLKTTKKDPPFRNMRKISRR